MSYSQKILTVIFHLQTGSFGNGGGNTLTLTNMRMSTTITLAGGDGQPYLNNLSIYGMSLAQMNQLSLTGNIFAQGGALKKNLVAVQAGDAETGMTTIFQGQIVEAYVDANQIPEVRFVVSANVFNWLSKTTAPPLSMKGAVDAKTMMQTLAGQMGLTLENSGVSKILSNPYLHGTAISQVKKLAESAGFQWIIDRGKLAIWPTGQTRNGSTPTISAQTGMVGYPITSQNSIVVVCLFNPSILFGGKIKVQSTLAGASGTWNVNQIVYELDSWTPHGRWFMEITGVSPSAATTEPSGEG